VTPEAAPAVSRAGWARTASTAVLLGCAVAGVWFAVRAGGSDIVAARADPAFVPLVAGAVLANVTGLVLAMLSWRAVLLGPGGSVPLLPAARMYFVGLLGKLVPGRVWGVMVQVQQGRALDLSGVRVVTTFLLNVVVAVLTAAAVGSVALPALPALPGLPGADAIWIAVPVALVATMLAWPRSVNRLAVIAARVVRRGPPGAPLPGRAVRRAVLMSVGSWLVTGLHVWCLALLFGAPAVRALPICVGAFALAAAAGVCVVVLPDGWGVRDVILLGALSTVMAPGAAGLTVLASRIVCAIGDLGTAGASVALVWASRRLKPAQRLTTGENY
jgi:hypothetical protein